MGGNGGGVEAVRRKRELDFEHWVSLKVFKVTPVKKGVERTPNGSGKSLRGSCVAWSSEVVSQSLCREWRLFTFL